MSLLAGLSQQGDSISAHNADAAAHTTTVDYSDRLTETGFINLTGTEVDETYQHWLRSALISVAPGDEVSIDAMGHPAINAVSFYNQGGVFVSGEPYLSEAPARLTKTILVPSGVATMRLCCVDPRYNISGGYISQFSGKGLALLALIAAVKNAEYEYRLRIATSAPRKIMLQSSDKILLYGDSISSEDYPWYASAMAGLTGATVWAGGFSGVNTAGLAADSRLQRIWDYGAKVCIVLVGGNDTGAAGTVGTLDGSVPGEPVVSETDIAADYAGTTYIQAVSHIVRRFAAHYGNIRVRANLTGSETEAEKTAKIDAVLKPVLVLCTPLPQKRNSAEDPFSDPTNWQRKRDAVVEVAAKYRVHCVDLFSAKLFSPAAEPFWTAPTDKTTNNGIWTMDGLHPNKYLYAIIAETVCASLGI